MIRHRENGKMSWTKRRDRETGGKPFGISDKTGRDENETMSGTARANETGDETQGGTRDETGEQRRTQ